MPCIVYRAMVREEKQMKQRLDWVDYAKGIGIILVVFTHNIGGQRLSGIALPEALAVAIPYAYSFHMPLFFFLSGLFVMRSYRKGFAPFLQSKVRTLFYPFVIWSLILGIVQTVMGAYVNHPLSGGHALLFFLIRPIEQMWFLQALFLIYVFFAMTQKIGLKPLSFFLVCAGLTLFVVPFIHDETVHRIVFHSIFFGAGVWLHDGVNTRLLNAKVGPLLAASFAALCVQLFLVFGPGRSQMFFFGTDIPARVITAFLGILSIAALSEVLNRTGRVHWLLVIGQYTMPIFLMHTILGSGTRIILLRILHLNDPYLHVAVELAVGVGIPMAIAFGLGRCNALWAFEWPTARRVENAH